jgi:triosephosphate isomerase
MKKLMAANWKMHKTQDEARAFVADLAGRLDSRLPADREVLICPAFTALAATAEAMAGVKGFHLGAQNFYPADKGAYTGEVSPDMLIDVCCEYSLAGHSERRNTMTEPDELVGEKVALGLKKGLKMVLCVGETLKEREADMLESVLTRHIQTGLKPSTSHDSTNLAVAYEPVWAIGTGKVAGPEDIVEAHTFIRKLLVDGMGAEGESVRILYGGSVKPDNASEIISLDNVDGVLVGGASLDAESFAAIATA